MISYFQRVVRFPRGQTLFGSVELPEFKELEFEYLEASLPANSKRSKVKVGSFFQFPKRKEKVWRSVVTRVNW